MQNLVLRLTKLLEITVLLSISLLFGITIASKKLRHYGAGLTLALMDV
jgi:hypothetical protein